MLNAYEELIPASTHPSYFLFFEVNPNTIDINIHPTKTEIKFQDEKLIYSVLRSTIKQALGHSNITPTLDFNTEKNLDLPYSYRDKPITPPQIKINPDYNPFKERVPKSSKENWEKLYTKESIPTDEAIEKTPLTNDEIINPSLSLEQTDLENIDERIDSKLNLTPNVAQKRDDKVALSNTFGFGGHNASVIFKKYE